LRSARGWRSATAPAESLALLLDVVLELVLEGALMLELALELLSEAAALDWLYCVPEVLGEGAALGVDELVCA